MNFDEIAAGESRTLEFKAVLPQDSRKWLKTIVAFANGAGGKLVVGVDDQRRVLGISDDIDVFEFKDKIVDVVATSCEPMIFPNVYAKSLEGKTIVVIQVYPGHGTPYHIKSDGLERGTFVRMGATSREADEAILDELRFRGKNIHYDEFPRPDIPVKKSDLSELCRDFSERAERRIQKKDLVNFKVLREFESGLQATNAYAILVGKHDFSSRIQCARFKGNDRTVFIDKKDFEGPLCKQIDGAFQFVLEHINMGLDIQGVTHKKVYELPTVALRELIVNAVVHRNYQLPSAVQVAVYDNRVEITSPGMLYGSLTVSDAVNGVTATRNRVLARTLEKIGVVEGWGSGLKRVQTLCTEAGVDFPEILELGNVLRFNFYRVKKNKKRDVINCSIDLNGRTSSGAAAYVKNTASGLRDVVAGYDTTSLTVREVSLLHCLSQQKNWTKSSLSQVLNCSTASVDRAIASLTKKNLIARDGANKNGTWVIVK
ncbi:RNA-binding domain-containing protein [Fibrobacter sp. UWEL]|uniref:RNA-binding domain-containing protein n=1 Tax=Fibrobacter sp. UWEL TaxID=1896209 RepID=UPI000922B6D2|nr:RNA-binding domain-containing protein [Fibrobacter sp. UWEL]SHL01098.1 Predicted transcriptional regulator, contains HTH domain [Fibrobacter sp. UWEL]